MRMWMVFVLSLLSASIGPLMLILCRKPVQAPVDCTAGLDLDIITRDHRSAWAAAFDGRPLEDRELVALGDAQALLDCLAAKKP